MSEDTRSPDVDSYADDHRADEHGAARRELREDDLARRDQTITSDPTRHDDRATAQDAMPEDERRRDHAADRDSRDVPDAGRAGDNGTDVHDVGRDPSSERRSPASGPDTVTEWSGDLLSSDDRSGYQKRWDDIQVRFIDEPRESVRKADDLVGEVTTRIADRFSSARGDMEQRWEGGNEPTTEELRQAVQRYRDFFQRLVAQ